MTLSTVISRAQRGIDAPQVHVETHLSNGLPAFHIVGLPATAVRESRERVRSALLNSHFDFPDGRITVSLAPADLPKDGGRFDLPIALGILAASGQLPSAALANLECIGELALDGSLRAVTGCVGAAIAATRCGRTLVVPAANAGDAALVPDSHILPAEQLLHVSAHLHGNSNIAPAQPTPPGAAPDCPDLADVCGQAQARRALEIAASGGHHLLMTGPPGTGKTMLASRLPGLLPQVDGEDLLEVMAMRSAVTADLSRGDFRQRPFRAPHHSASARALAGGGSQLPRPGEISLAHCGVLFLDELPEFPRSVLEVLREPLESRHITISRASTQVTYPARFQLVAAMNPCPCGYEGDPGKPCRCSPDQVSRYRARVSGPLLDRIDIQINLQRLPAREIAGAAGAAQESSQQVRERVIAARLRQASRAGRLNAELNTRQLAADCALRARDATLLEQAVDRLGLSVRAWHRVLRVSRTIADLDASDSIRSPHLLEALTLRQQAEAGLPGSGHSL